MENLIKPAEYAKQIGISRQAVYAKIKKGILQSKNVEGKLYIVVDDKSQVSTTSSKVSSPSEEVKDLESLLAAKDETISVLKSTVKDLKKSNKQISTTLKGEVDLLKDAFHEMRSLYVHQLRLKDTSVEENIIEVDSSDEDEVVWLSLKKFFKQQEISKVKKQEKLLKKMNKLYHKGDKRFMYINKKFKLNAKADYKDILNK